MTGGKIQRLRVERFPRVMEMRVEYPPGKNWEGWGDMLLPRFLVWGGVRYEFLAMIAQDLNDGVDHFTSVTKIGGKLYKHGEHETRLSGHMRLIDTTDTTDTTANRTEDVRVSTLLSAEYNERPSRFYYERVGKEDGAGDWTRVRPDLRVGGTTSKDSPVDVEKLWDETMRGKMDIDGEGKLMVGTS
jgi:hypothetical protein